MEDRTCIVPECAKAKKGMDKYCSMHRSRLTRTGSLDLPESYQGKKIPLDEALWAKTHKTSDCWVWMGAKNNEGYGQTRQGGKITYVHRLSYEIHKGSIPSGMVVDHIYRTRSCVRPDHLRLATTGQNAENQSNQSNRAASGYRGVAVARGKWRAQVTHKGQWYNGGAYDKAEDALAAVIDLRLRLHTHNVEDRVPKKV